ncbi:MAG: hypothetical protein ACI82F_001173 [Planctomycetota bacterium]
MLALAVPEPMTARMKPLAKRLEDALACFATLIDTTPELVSEAAKTRAIFAQGQDQDGQLGARRHQEWFLFERPSEHLEGVPVEALREPWMESAGSLEQDIYDGLLTSYASAFLVEEVEHGSGLLARDLFGVSQLAVHEPDAAGGLEVGDLLVGRVYPIGGEGFVLSPSVTYIRDASLVEALQRDIQGLRASRRGVLRIQQSELERMFFGGGSYATSNAAPDTLEPEIKIVLEKAGLSKQVAAGTVARVRSASNGAEVTEILNELAFHTDVELKSARDALSGLWSAKRTNAGVGTGNHVEENAGGSSRPEFGENRIELELPEEDETPGIDRESIRAALDNFDQKRAEGLELEALFGQLESELELPVSETEDTDATDGQGAPDFPGVVSAMVTEFRWEAEQSRGADAEPAGWRHLDAFGKAASSVGVFEDLSADELVSFASTHALNNGLLRSADDARDLIGALQAFAAWCDDDQGLVVWAEFRPLCEGLMQSLPRLAEARRTLGIGAASGGAVYEIVNIPEAGADAKGQQEIELGLVTGCGFDELEDLRSVKVTAALAAKLERGDLTRVSGSHSAGAVVGVHPSEARAVFLTVR